VGGRSGPAVPADRGGLHPEGRNKVKEPSEAQLAARRGGTKGCDAHPRQTSAGGNAIA